MPYTLVVDAKAGVDRRRPISCSPPGSLYELIDGHISRGGDIEKRKAFVVKYTLPAGTFGMAKASGGLYTFGSIASPTMPTGVTYQRLEHPSALAMTKVWDVDTYGGYLYVIAEYSDGSIHHFYNGTRVADWGGVDVGDPSGDANACLTFGQKMYAIAGSLLEFSKSGDASLWNTVADVGAGFINLSNHDSGSETLTGIETYQNNLAVFARRTVQIWFVDEDDDLNRKEQVLKRTGTMARRSILSYGDSDVFYLSDSGIRSLKPRDVSVNATAYPDDIGTPIDPLILEYLSELTGDEIAESVAVIEPIDGRYWIAIGDRIFVYSFFPKASIAAWSYYDPGFVVSDFVDLDNRIYARSGDTIYLYGGEDNATYDGTFPVVQFPFLSSDKPATYKMITGLDLDCEGSWSATIAVDPRDTDRVVRYGEFDGISYNEGHNAGMGHATHVAPRFVNTSAGYARISNIAIHFQRAEQES